MFYKLLEMQNQRLFITEGTQIGRLTVGPYVQWLQNHPLFLTTPKSYLKQGKLREVKCACGQSRLIAESILSTGRIQSCGCLRAELREQAAGLREEYFRLKQQQKQLTFEIKEAQRKLKTLQNTPVPFRNEKEIEECGAKIRQLFQASGEVDRKLKVKRKNAKR